MLAEYARHFTADPARWFFLTGEPRRLNDLGLNAFKLNSVDGSLAHSTRFVLVDRQAAFAATTRSTKTASCPSCSTISANWSAKQS